MKWGNVHGAKGPRYEHLKKGNVYEHYKSSN
jgi:hypothetical protein